MRPLRLPFAIVLGLLTLLVAAPAWACGGLVNTNGSVTLVRTTTLAAYHQGIEHYVTSFEFAGGEGEFGSIIPLPGVPTKVIRGGDWTLQRLVQETQPQPRVLAFAAAAPRGRGSGPRDLEDRDRRARHRRARGRRQGGRRLGARARVLPASGRARGPRLLRRAKPDLHDGAVRREPRRRAGSRHRRRHPRPCRHPDHEPMGPPAHPGARRGRRRARRGRRLPAHRPRARDAARAADARASQPVSRGACAPAWCSNAARRRRARCSPTSGATRAWTGSPRGCGSPTCASTPAPATSTTTSRSTRAGPASRPRWPPVWTRRRRPPPARGSFGPALWTALAVLVLLGVSGSASAAGPGARRSEAAMRRRLLAAVALLAPPRARRPPRRLAGGRWRGDPLLGLLAGEDRGRAGGDRAVRGHEHGPDRPRVHHRRPRPCRSRTSSGPRRSTRHVRGRSRSRRARRSARRSRSASATCCSGATCRVTTCTACGARSRSSERARCALGGSASGSVSSSCGVEQSGSSLGS